MPLRTCPSRLIPQIPESCLQFNLFLFNLSQVRCVARAHEVSQALPQLGDGPIDLHDGTGDAKVHVLFKAIADCRARLDELREA
jgi:hypothetical protein